MANIFRNFQMNREESRTRDDLDDEDQGVSVMGLVRHTGRLLSRPLRSNTRKFSKGFKGDEGVDADEHAENAPVSRSSSRKKTRSSTKVVKGATEAVKDGVGKLRRNLRKMTQRAGHGRDELGGEKKVTRRLSKELLDSKEKRLAVQSGSTSEAAESFRSEVKKSVKVHTFIDFLWDQAEGKNDELDEMVQQIIGKWQDTLDLLISEAWHIAQHIFRHEQREAESIRDMAYEAQARCREAHTEYLREITQLRDQIRKLPLGEKEELRCTFFSPLEHHDPSTRELVLACSEEKVKEMFSNMHKEDNIVGLAIQQKVQEKQAELVKNEHDRVECIFQRKINEMQREADILKVDLENTKSEMVAQAANSQRVEEDLRAELDSARKSAAESAKLQKIWEKECLKSAEVTALAANEKSSSGFSGGGEEEIRTQTPPSLGEICIDDSGSDAPPCEGASDQSPRRMDSRDSNPFQSEGASSQTSKRSGVAGNAPYQGSATPKAKADAAGNAPSHGSATPKAKASANRSAPCAAKYHSNGLEGLKTMNSSTNFNLDATATDLKSNVSTPKLSTSMNLGLAAMEPAMKSIVSTPKVGSSMNHGLDATKPTKKSIMSSTKGQASKVGQHNNKGISADLSLPAGGLQREKSDQFSALSGDMSIMPATPKTPGASAVMPQMCPTPSNKSIVQQKKPSFLGRRKST